VDVIVEESDVEGKGVFALRDFKKGEVVLDWSSSPVLTQEEIKRLSAEQEKFVYYLGNGGILVNPPARFVNHSCDPNTFIRGFFGIAKRGIKKGEEITEDYLLEDNPNLYFACKCRSNKCRGIIVGRKKS